MSKNARKNWSLFDDDRSDDDIISAALAVLERRMRYTEAVMSSPDATRSYLRLKFAGLEHEVFAVLFLDNRQIGRAHV